MNVKKMEHIDVFIVGAGGFAAELTEYIVDNNNNTNKRINIKGYFDINIENYKKYDFKAPFLGNEVDYDFKEGSIVLIASGDSNLRKKVVENLQYKKIKFENFIHYSCLISRTSKIGKGNIICPNVIIGPNTVIGNFNLINYKTALPHDCEVGNLNTFSPNVQITGYCKIGNMNFFGVSSGCTPKTTIGNNNKIQAGVIVAKKVSDKSIVFSMEKIKSMKLY